MKLTRISPLLPILCMVAAIFACQGEEKSAREGDSMLDEIAESYVRLVLTVGNYDADYVDAYYGEPAWRVEAEAATDSLPQLQAEAERLLDAVEAVPKPEDPILARRQKYLAAQLVAVEARLRMLQGEALPFDEESAALYDAVAPQHDEVYFEQRLANLEPLLPGEGSIDERWNRFRAGFVIPPEKLDEVFQAAIQACRERTGVELALPEGEAFSLEYVTDKPWSGYNWYQGEFASLIQVNTDLPIFIDRAIDLACHEGYPGHHVYNALLEKHLVRDRGWVEFSVYPLFSPQSLIAEGTANYGIEIAFPGEQRVAFERDVLFPLAGLDASTADVYYEALEQVSKLSYAGNEAARRYLDGEIDAEAAAEFLARYAMMAPDRARQRVQFIERYRSYVINYNLGLDRVRAYVERVPEEQRWSRFAELLSSPRLPSDL